MRSWNYFLGSPIFKEKGCWGVFQTMAGGLMHALRNRFARTPLCQAMMNDQSGLGKNFLITFEKLDARDHAGTLLEESVGYSVRNV